jgi:hypothetical protein
MVFNYVEGDSRANQPVAVGSGRLGDDTVISIRGIWLYCGGGLTGATAPGYTVDNSLYLSFFQ